MKAFRNTRHDLIRAQSSNYDLSLGRGRACNIPITRSGEVLYRGSEVFEFAPAMHLHSSNSGGNLLCYASASRMDEWLDLLQAHGFVGVNLMQFDQPFNPIGGRPLTIWTDSVATAYNANFFTGANGAAGWDYFHAACSARGLYVGWRGNQTTSIYLNRGVSGPGGKPLVFSLDDIKAAGAKDASPYAVDPTGGDFARAFGR